MSKTFLSVVNSAILESGADLDQFSTDGSNWDSTLVDSLMQKFKVWVNRAWQTVQQNAYDWEWMSEQAVVTITPGIMFYSKNPINFTASDINPMALYDVDGTVTTTGLTPLKIKDLTGVYTKDSPFAYVDIQYNDYSFTNKHSIDFGIKSGGQTIGLDKNAPKRIRFAVQKVVVERPPAIGTPVTNMYMVGGTDTTTFTLTGGKITNVINKGSNILIFDIDYSSISTDFWSKIIEYSEAQTDITNWQIEVGFQAGEDGNYFNGVIAPPGSSRILDTNSASVSPSNYYVDFVGSTSVRNGTVFPLAIKDYIFTTDNTGCSGTWTGTCTGTVQYATTDTTNGSINLEIISDDCYPGDQVGGGGVTSLFCQLLMTLSTGAQAQIHGAQFGNVVAGSDSILETSTILYNAGAVKTTWTWNVGLDFTTAGYVHSWKSFDWGEELDDDDFVEDIAEVDEQSFSLVTREDPAPGMEIKLPFMHWEIFRVNYDNTTIPPSQPRVVTKDNVGRWRFYPPPDQPYTVLFNYVRNPQQLVAFDDVIKGIPDDFIDIIIMRTLIYYGEYDEQPSVVQRATRNYKDLLFRLEMRFRDKFHFVPIRLW